LSFFWIALLAVLVLGLTYRFSEINNYFIGLKRIILEAAKHGHTSFLSGKYSNTGWRHYYLIAFLLKTPLALLIFIVLRLIWGKKLSNRWEYFLFIPVILIFLSASFSRKQLGLRYILPIYPFLFVLLGNIVNYQTKNKSFKIFLILTSIWYLFSSLRIYPHHLAYFNELAGGPENGWKYLAESNIDWGQDLKGLKKYLEKEKVDGLILSYFGTADPLYYRIDYQDLGTSTLVPFKGRINPLEPRREILAISVNNLLCLYFYNRDLFIWLRKKSPLTKIGYSIFIYEITNDLYSHEYLAQIYYNSGWNEEARQECQRLLLLQPDNPVAYFTLACLSAEEKRMEEAVKDYEKSLAKRPDFLPARLNLLSYFSLVLRSSREVRPEPYYQSLFNLATYYFSRGANNRALSLYQRIVQLYPDAEEGYNNLGVAYERLNKNEEAINAYQQAIKLNPNFADAYFNLGIIYWKENQWDKVIEQLENVLRIEPKNTQAQKYLSLAREKLSKK